VAQSKVKETKVKSDNISKRATVLLSGNDIEEKRQEILDYFHETFSLYESLFECLSGDESFYARANNLRHPLIFYYGHTAVFFINKLNVARLIKGRVDNHVESLCAIGVDEMSWDDLDNKKYNWPTSREVKSYRDKTRDIVDDFISTCEFTLPIEQDSPLWLIMMGIEHENIHIETSAVLIRELELKYVRNHEFWGVICNESATAPKNKLLPVAGGKITLGKDRDDRLYGWDNEYGHRDEDVKDFKASKYLVSNEEYLEFVKGDGYKTKEYWTDEGWAWVNFKNAEQPSYWVESGETYKYRAMLEVIDMPWDWPVDINYFEAKAFCNWKNKNTGKNIRMPTEAEWYMLRKNLDEDLPDWNEAPGNINLEKFMSSCPVNKFEFKGGFFDIIGNLWQWTETPLDSFDGFEVHPAYDDFSVPTFDGKHNIFKGGCWVSRGNYAIKDSRYAFRRHFLQYSGLRYIEGEEIKTPKTNSYETDNIVSQYIEFHYGDEYLGVPNFPLTCANAAIDYMKGKNTKRAFDIGCASGRVSFELAKVFDHVDGFDFSTRLIQTPVNLQKNSTQRYIIQEEGDISLYKEVNLTALGLHDVADKVSFVQGDACNLADKFTDYDLIFAGNLIDRLYDPKMFLSMIHERILSGGLLILTSPYTWLQEFTDRDKWLGGFKDSNGENFTTQDGLKKVLSDNFKFIDKKDIPFIIRETKRKFQHTISEISIWERK